MGDSLPDGLLEDWRIEREAWLRHHPRPWTAELYREYHSRFSLRFEEWLDEGGGSCLLRDPKNAAIVAGALRHFDGSRYVMHTFVVMPNHVHVLFQPTAPHTISDVIQTWKRYTARQLNLMNGRKGKFWQEEYFDRLIRSAAHYETCRAYIKENPLKARLSVGEFVLYDKGDVLERSVDF